MTNLNFLALAVPFFIFFMFLEYWVSRRQGKQYFSFATSVSNSTGIYSWYTDESISLENQTTQRKVVSKK